MQQDKHRWQAGCRPEYEMVKINFIFINNELIRFSNQLNFLSIDSSINCAKVFGTNINFQKARHFRCMSYFLISFLLIFTAHKVSHPGHNSIPSPFTSCLFLSLVSSSKNNHNSASHDIKIIN
jgi:hypothetical protein